MRPNPRRGGPFCCVWRPPTPNTTPSRSDQRPLRAIQPTLSTHAPLASRLARNRTPMRFPATIPAPGRRVNPRLLSRPNAQQRTLRAAPRRLAPTSHPHSRRATRCDATRCAIPRPIPPRFPSSSRSSKPFTPACPSGLSRGVTGVFAAKWAVERRGGDLQKNWVARGGATTGNGAGVHARGARDRSDP